MSQNTKIIVCYHKDFNILENEVLLPIHVGKANHPNVLENMQGDNTGDNISHKNDSYCELTGMYWLWKNIKADNYGLFHYRRLLDLKNRYKGENYPSKININDFNSDIINKEMEKFDIILPKLSKFKISLYDYYKRDHHIKDLEIIKNIIREKYPNYEQATEKALNAKEGFFCNMFIMKKEIFNEYCTWLFDILETAETLIDTTDYDSYQKRVLGFLSERMLSIFIEYKKQTCPNLKIREVNTIYLNPEPSFKINFLIGQYIKFPDRHYLELFKIKFLKKAGVKNGK